jgi:ABC-type Fe3+-hydroxamate transport system substrate-binding protein
MGLIRITDDRKRELTFGKAPARVVSLVPSDTYNVAALGCGAALVARTDYCDLPEDLVKKLPSIGGTKNPKLDAILDLAPDFIIANQEENSKGDIERLIDRGVRVYIGFPKRAADGIAHLARLARIFRVEHEPAARTLLKKGYDVIREAEEARMRVVPVRTFCPIWMKPLMTINGETFISDMLHLAGAENVFADRKRRYPLAADLTGALSTIDEEGRDTRYPRLSEEELIGRAPELVLLPDEPHPFTEEDAATFRKLAIPAASRGAIVRMSGKDLCWYGARTIEGLPRLRALVEQHGKRALA